MDFLYLECPYYKKYHGDPNPGMGTHGEGTCNLGCSEEPSCITSEPMEGWDPTMPDLWVREDFLPISGIGLVSTQQLFREVKLREEVKIHVIDEDGYLVHEFLDGTITGVDDKCVEFTFNYTALEAIL